MWYETDEMGSTVSWVEAAVVVAAAGGGLGRPMKVTKWRAASAVKDVVIGAQTLPEHM